MLDPKEGKTRLRMYSDFVWLLTKAVNNDAPERYGGSIPRALMGATLQVPEAEREQWARFCYAMGHSVVSAADEERW